MLDTAQLPLLTIAIQAGSFIAAFAAIAAGVLMFSVTKKFGTGILASGFKRISIGVLLIAGGIIIDSVQSYMLQFSFFSNNQIVAVGIILSKDILFVLGTFIIVIGSKTTGDKLENLTK